MKPRTKLQKTVVELSAQLPALTNEQRKWAEEKCFKKTGYLFRKGWVWCHECGTEFKAQIPPLAADLDIAEATCPVCGKKMKVTNCKKHEYSEEHYFTILTTMGGMQVCRHFEIVKYSCRGRHGAHYNICEVVRNWVSEKGKEVIQARSVAANYSYYTYAWSSPLSLKVAKSYYDNIQQYYINAEFTYPKRKILPILRRNGYNARFQGIAPNELFKMLLTDHEAETLMKAKRYDLLEYRYLHVSNTDAIEPLIKVAIRHNYYPKDVGMWFDYINMCKELEVDVHNPHYLCPKNLAEAHDIILKKLEKKRAEDKRKRDMEVAVKYEKKYLKEKGKYFGICFGDDNIVITVIKSVAEMAEEGSAMHHCVFSMKYYKKPESLIMSAKDKQGNRIETIEVSLKTFEVVQSRGVCNKNTEYHDTILSLVKNNINLIRKAV